MLVALFCCLMVAASGGGTSAGESFVKELDKIVGKQLKDPAARTEAKAAVGEMKAALEEYDAKLERTSQDIARSNESAVGTAADFESAVRVLDGARSDAFIRLVAAREKLRAAIPADQWDAIVGKAARAKP
jgi:hypothetical protein